MGIHADLIARARDVRIEDEIERSGIRLVGGTDRCGPCPNCGGRDRFSINTGKQVFNCRGCDAKGDVIALVQFLDGCDFREAIERLTGESSDRTARAAASATPRQMAFHRVNREVKEGRDLHQRLVEDVLQDDDAALEGGELETVVLTSSVAASAEGIPSAKIIAT